LFLDGAEGFYQRTTEFKLICPETGEIVIAVKTVSGDNHHEEPSINQSLRATGRFENAVEKGASQWVD
jgi:hypothetical protein